MNNELEGLNKLLSDYDYNLVVEWYNVIKGTHITNSTLVISDVTITYDYGMVTYEG